MSCHSHKKASRYRDKHIPEELLHRHHLLSEDMPTCGKLHRRRQNGKLRLSPDTHPFLPAFVSFSRWSC